MALCKHGCGTDLTWVEGAGGKSRPYGPDGQPHRCAEGLAAWRAGQVSYGEAPKELPLVYLGRAAEVERTPLPYSAPVERSEVQELRHAVQRLSRAVELLTEAVQALSERDLQRT